MSGYYIYTKFQLLIIDHIEGKIFQTSIAYLKERRSINHCLLCCTVTRKIFSILFFLLDLGWLLRLSMGFELCNKNDMESLWRMHTSLGSLVFFSWIGPFGRKEIEGAFEELNWLLPFVGKHSWLCFTGFYLYLPDFFV